jgi:hypothetical protein
LISVHDSDKKKSVGFVKNFSSHSPLFTKYALHLLYLMYTSTTQAVSLRLLKGAEQEILFCGGLGEERGVEHSTEMSPEVDSQRNQRRVASADC